MPQLLRLRLVSVGHRLARMDDLTLDFRDAGGGAADSTIWLRNGGGKSSILNLLFAILRPHRSEFLGGQSDAKQRSLDDYILTGDRSVTAAEWSLDAAADTLGLEGERMITGVFYERRDVGGELRRLFFSSRVSPAHPESALEGLPVYITTAGGNRQRSALSGFRQAWQSLRDRAPHLGISATEHQGEWQETLEAARLDPELFWYQIQMNRREGGVDELFRFSSTEDFADFLLQLALEPSLAGEVGRNIATWREELVRRREQLQPELELVSGMQVGLDRLREVSEERGRLREVLREVRVQIREQTKLVDGRRKGLEAEAAATESEQARHEAAAGASWQGARGHRARAAGLRRHAAGLRLREHQDELRTIDEQLREQRRLVKIWTAAEPLRSALRFEQSARSRQLLLEERQREHAPLRAQLGEAAGRLAAALKRLAADSRQEAGRASQDAAAARAQALEYRKQAAEERGNIRVAETQAAALGRRLAEADARAANLAGRGLLQAGEGAEAALRRWTETLKARQAEIAATQARIDGAGEALEALERSAQAAAAVLADASARVQIREARLGEATADREAVESDTTLQAALELETIDADRLDPQALAILDQAAQNEQREALDARLRADLDQRALDHLAEWGLLPPSEDVLVSLALLRARLGGQAWSGWEWMATNVPAGERADLARRAPYLAEGVVVRATDLERAVAVLRDAGAMPDGPLALTTAPGSDVCATGGDPAGEGVNGHWPQLPAVVLGPGEAAFFDRQAGRAKRVILEARASEAQSLIQAAEARHRELVRARQALERFRQRYPLGWFADAASELDRARRDEAEQSRRLGGLQAERRAKLAERRALEDSRGRLELEVRAAQGAVQALEGHVADYVRPAAGWRRELAAAQEAARAAAAEAGQWNALAKETDERAEASSRLAQGYGEAAARHEQELRSVSYLDGPVDPAPGPLDQLRTTYEAFRSSYEQRVGADQLAALARQDWEHGREQRDRLARLLSADVTEAVVQSHLEGLANPDEIDSMREQAEGVANSLFGSVGRLNQRIQAEEETLRRAEQLCSELGVGASLSKAPRSPHLAEGEANQLDEAGGACEVAARESEAAAGQARESVRALRERIAGLEALAARISDLSEDYGDLFAAVPESEQPATAVPRAAAPGAAGEGPVPGHPRQAIDESAVSLFVRDAAGRLRRARDEQNKLDGRRQELAAGVRSAAGITGAAVREQAQWVNRVIAHPDPELEDASARLAEHLALRRKTLEDQLAEIDKHRAVLAAELLAVAEDGLRLFRQASALSRLPEDIARIGGAQFLRITTGEPDQPEERLARMAQLVDELARGDRALDGIGLAQSAVRRLARPIQVRVLHPDPALERHSVSIPEMARFSGGEQLTGAILLYCTLAAVRGRARGQSRMPSSVLVLDNPIGRASRPQFLRLQRDVARAMGVQLIYTTAVNDHEALSALPNIIRLRNDRVDRNTGRRLVEPAEEEDSDRELGVLRAVRIGRRERGPEAARAVGAATAQTSVGTAAALPGAGLPTAEVRASSEAATGLDQTGRDRSGSGGREPL